MTLFEFALAQTAEVERIVAEINAYVDRDPDFDTYAASLEAIRTNPMLQGVCAADLTTEAMFPGSFRKLNLTR